MGKVRGVKEKWKGGGTGGGRREGRGRAGAGEPAISLVVSATRMVQAVACLESLLREERESEEKCGCKEGRMLHGVSA